MEHQILPTAAIFQGCFIVLPFPVVYMVEFWDYIILGPDTLGTKRQEVPWWSRTSVQHGSCSLDLEIFEHRNKEQTFWRRLSEALRKRICCSVVWIWDWRFLCLVNTQNTQKFMCEPTNTSISIHIYTCVAGVFTRTHAVSMHTGMNTYSGTTSPLPYLSLASSLAFLLPFPLCPEAEAGWKSVVSWQSSHNNSSLV